MSEVIYKIKDYYYFVLGATNGRKQAIRSTIIYYLELKYGYHDGLEEYVTNKENMKAAYNELKKFIAF